jgi:hypothetical protein
MHVEQRSVAASGPVHGTLRRGTWLRMIGITVLFVGLLAAAFLAWTERRDRKLLRQIAETVTDGIDSPGARLVALNKWVYGNKGFAPNKRYFGVRRLGPTPIHVLEHGGDCADKSRLLSAMLETIGIRSSLAMLYPCEGCPPVHTVVVADLGTSTTLADPVFDIVFPRPEGGYYSVQQLVQQPRLLSERLGVLRAERGPEDKITLYREANHRYDYLRTINWDANALTRVVAWVVQAMGSEPRYVFRPMWLENPKRALTYAALLVALAGVAMSLEAGWWRK